MARTTDKLRNFEKNYDKLAELVKNLENPELTLKQSLDLYEKAVKLAADCEDALTYAKEQAESLAAAQAAKGGADDGI